jgi:uncharacterized membrane protein
MDLSGLLPYLLFLHVLGAIVAFGPTFAFRFIGAMGGGEPQYANFATRVSNTLAHRLVYPIGITLPITGAAMMLVRGYNPSDRAYWWLGLAIVLYVIAYGYSYFYQSRLVGRVIAMTSSPPPPGASGPPPELMALAGRIRQGALATTVLLIAIIFLMVVKPTV